MYHAGKSITSSTPMTLSPQEFIQVGREQFSFHAFNSIPVGFYMLCVRTCDWVNKSDRLISSVIMCY